MVAQIGKSVIIIKRLTVAMQENGIIERENWKRNGFWEVEK